MEKCEVNGKECHDVWKYLRVNSVLYDAKKKRAKEIPWNFAKFLMDKDGHVIKYYNPRIDPVGMIGDIQDLLKEEAK